MIADALNLITEQEQEIERLKNENIALKLKIIDYIVNGDIEAYGRVVKQAKIEVLERLKSMMTEREYMGVKYKQGIFSESGINQLIEEVKAE